MTTPPTSDAVIATARTAGLELPPKTGARIVSATTPVFAAFSAVSGTLPLDVEPASFQIIQMRDLSK